jgi:hypothetical protein
LISVGSLGLRQPPKTLRQAAQPERQRNHHHTEDKSLAADEPYHRLSYSVVLPSKCSSRIIASDLVGRTVTSRCSGVEQLLNRKIRCEFSKSFLRGWQPSYSQPSEKMVWHYLVKYFVSLQDKNDSKLWP